MEQLVENTIDSCKGKRVLSEIMSKEKLAKVLKDLANSKKKWPKMITKRRQQDEIYLEMMVLRTTVMSMERVDHLTRREATLARNKINGALKKV